MARLCVVKHSQTKGEPSHVVQCFTKKSEAEALVRSLNRGAGMGRHYAMHKESVVRMWRDRGDPGDWLFGARRRRRR